MSIARHHAEWLSLIEVSGPFLSMPVLMRAFPQGLEAHDSDRFRTLRAAYDEWEEKQGTGRFNPAIHAAWIKFVLNEILELPDEVILQGQAVPQSIQATVAEQGETLRPDLVIKNPDGHPQAGKPRLLIQTYPYTQDLDKPVAGRTWKATPGTRMMELLHASGVRLGLVTTGEQWMLVDAPKGETTGLASWYAHLWLEEQITFRAFRSLLNVERFFNVADADTLESLLAESAANQQEVTDQLGYQVRKAVEVLIQSLDRADQDHGRELLKDVSEPELYEAALTVMMRVVFLFCAEERGLLLLDDELYAEHYAVSTIREQLRETADQHGEEILERRRDAWCRLLSTFRLVYGGADHDRMSLPAYGGRLFDPDRFPFLEGRPKGTNWRDTAADPLPVNNRTVLHLLEALQILQVRVPGGGPAEARRLSFRALDIEQIGHVYEGLLDHTAKRATEPVLGLIGTRDREPEIPLATLEAMLAKGEPAFIEYVKDETGRSASAIKKALTGELDLEQSQKLQTACGTDKTLWKRIQPLGGLVRSNTFGYPVIIHSGSVYVTTGTDRRSSGTHYTPRVLTEPIVQHTLEPLVYIGPAEGKPKEQWQLRTAAELLALRICDMTCGSGAFLVQGCRYLSERLVEAWEKAELVASAPRSTASSRPSRGVREVPDAPPNPQSPIPARQSEIGNRQSTIRITPFGEPSTGAAAEQLVPTDPDERMAYARRLVAQRCLYGVDINPLAVEMAKLSLWLLTLAKDKPFTFLDHAIRCGDSLLGIHDLKQLKTFSLDGTGQQYVFGEVPMDQLVDKAIELRLQIESMPSNTVEDVQAQSRLMAECEQRVEFLKCAADLLIAAELKGGSPREKLGHRDDAAIQIGHFLKSGKSGEFRAAAANALGARRTFHWPLEFPETMFREGGFNAFIGNPPFMGGLKLFSQFGREYRTYLIDFLAHGVSGIRGTADLCVYFFLRAALLVRRSGSCGFVATNTIAQGDSREAGLEQLLSHGITLYKAVQSRRWPGAANLEVAHVWFHFGTWSGARLLDGAEVAGITSQLAPEGVVRGKPFPLKSNINRAFIGSYVFGLGFCLSPDEADRLIRSDARNKNVLFPYLDGDDLNSRYDQSPSRWVINFFDWELSPDYDDPSRPKGPPYASDYPDCLRIVEERVKPERIILPPINHFNKGAAKRWWHYGGPRESLYAALRTVSRVLVTARVSATNAVAWMPSNLVFHEKVVCFPNTSDFFFAIMQSSLHWEWARRYTSSLGAVTNLNYAPSACFESFPFPKDTVPGCNAGKAYDETRRQIMLVRAEGLTSTYGRFHDPDEAAKDIQKLRDLHAEMDKAVAAAYGWDDLNLGHGFHETRQGTRFTISEPARREVLARLLQLNHERYAEEVAQGLHEKKRGAGSVRRGAKRSGGKPQAEGSGTLFGPTTAEPSTQARGVSSPEPDTNDGDAPAKPSAALDMSEPVAEATGVVPRAPLERTPASAGGSDRAPPHVSRAPDGQAGAPPIEQLDYDDLIQAIRTVAASNGEMPRDEFLVAVARELGYARTGAKIRDAIDGAIRAAARRGIVETGFFGVSRGKVKITDWTRDDLVDTLCSVLRKGSRFSRDEAIKLAASHIGFKRVGKSIDEAFRSALNGAIRRGLIGYEGDLIWREA